MFSKDFLTEKAIYELNKSKKIKPQNERNDLIYKTGDKKKDKSYVYRRFNTVRFFGGEIFNDELTLEGSLEEKTRLTNSKNLQNHKSKKKNKKKIDF